MSELKCMWTANVEVRECTRNGARLSGLPTVDTVPAIYRAQSALVSLIPINQDLERTSHWIQDGSRNIENNFSRAFSLLQIANCQKGQIYNLLIARD